MNETQTKMLIDGLKPYLDKAAESDAELLAAMQKDNKSDKELADYLVYHYTHCESKSVIADGNEVMALAIQYYKDDSIVIPSLSSAKKPAPKATDAPKAEDKPKAEKKPSAAKPKGKAKAKEIQMFDMFADL